MSLILNEKYCQKKDYRLFLTNRIYRIFPVYYLISILSIALLITTNQFGPTKILSGLENFHLSSIALIIVSQVTIIGQDLFSFLTIDKNGFLIFTSDFWNENVRLTNYMLLPQAWTISLELMFYLIAPFILRKNIKLIIGIIILSIFGRMLLIMAGLRFDPWTYRFFPNELAFFLAGAISYYFYNRIKEISIHKMITASIFILILAACFTFRYWGSFKPALGLYYLLFVPSVSIIFKASKSIPTDRWIGELSYPIYLSHFLFINLFNLFLPYGDNLNVLSVIICTILFSIMCESIITKPIEKFRQRRAASLLALENTIQSSGK